MIKINYDYKKTKKINKVIRLLNDSYDHDGVIML